MHAQVFEHPSRGGRVIAAILAALLLAVLSVAVSAQPAHAAARVDVSPAPNADGSTTVTLTGSGFQYLPNAPGGVYIFFGAVSDPTTNAWAPSQGGKSGTTFGYANASGSILLAAFQGGSSAEAANAVIDANGNWTAQMTIPGSSFPSSSGNPHAGQAVEGATIDCLQVQCGVITIGAHGMVNANNESFTPVGFVTAGGQIQSGSGAQSFTDDATVLEIPEEADTEAAEDPAAAEASEAVTETAESPESAGNGTATILVLAVLGLAVLALVAAIFVVVLKRARERARRVPPMVTPEPESSERQAHSE